MRQQLELLAARSRYRDAEEICSRLSTLRSTYEENIRHLIQEDNRHEWSGLFGIIEEREGRIVSPVREQMEDLLSELSRIEEQGGSHDLYKLTSPKIEEIKAQMAELNSFTNRILGLSGKPGMLEMLKDPSEAKLVVKNLAIFSRRKYVENKYTTNGANLSIIGAGASVSGGVANTKIRSYNLPDLAQ
ncbi:MAG: hypothetical protein ABW003_04495 [Microvirga sp.]